MHPSHNNPALLSSAPKTSFCPYPNPYIYSISSEDELHTNSLSDQDFLYCSMDKPQPDEKEASEEYDDFFQMLHSPRNGGRSSQTHASPRAATNEKSQDSQKQAQEMPSSLPATSSLMHTHIMPPRNSISPNEIHTFYPSGHQYTSVFDGFERGHMQHSGVTPEQQRAQNNETSPARHPDSTATIPYGTISYSMPPSANVGAYGQQIYAHHTHNQSFVHLPVNAHIILSTSTTISPQQLWSSMSTTSATNVMNSAGVDASVNARPRYLSIPLIHPTMYEHPYEASFVQELRGTEDSSLPNIPEMTGLEIPLGLHQYRVDVEPTSQSTLSKKDVSTETMDQIQSSEEGNREKRRVQKKRSPSIHRAKRDTKRKSRHSKDESSLDGTSSDDDDGEEEEEEEAATNDKETSTKKHRGDVTTEDSTNCDESEDDTTEQPEFDYTSRRSDSKRAQLTNEQRNLIIRLHSRGKSLRDIAKRIKCTLSAVQYTVKKYARFQTVDNLPKCGRTPLLNTISNEKFFEIFNSIQVSTSRERLDITAKKISEIIGHEPSQKTIFKEWKRRSREMGKMPSSLRYGGDKKSSAKSSSTTTSPSEQDE